MNSGHFDSKKCPTLASCGTVTWYKPWPILGSIRITHTHTKGQASTRWSTWSRVCGRYLYSWMSLEPTFRSGLPMSPGPRSVDPHWSPGESSHVPFKRSDFLHGHLPNWRFMKLGFSRPMFYPKLSVRFQSLLLKFIVSLPWRFLSFFQFHNGDLGLRNP